MHNVPLDVPAHNMTLTGYQRPAARTGWAYLVGYPNTGKEELIKSSRPVFSYATATHGSLALLSGFECFAILVRRCQ
eukprot:4871802-Ditylum_brightwellii.AAC.1